ncbi:hypothetical protein MHYP_G00106000 [Metynnis hypsauchen]
MSSVKEECEDVSVMEVTGLKTEDQQMDKEEILQDKIKEEHDPEVKLFQEDSSSQECLENSEPGISFTPVKMFRGMSDTLTSLSAGESGVDACRRRSVGLGTDLSMAEIEHLQTEIAQLRKEVAKLQTELRRWREGECKREELENIISPSLGCKSKSTPILLEIYENMSRDQHMLPKLEDELSLAVDSKTEPNNAQAHHEDQLNLLMLEDLPTLHLPNLEDEPTIAVEFKPEINHAQAHHEDHHNPLMLEDLSTFCEEEPSPTEECHSVHDGGLQHIVQTALKMCSVRLVDCRKMMGLKGNITAEDDGNDSEGDDDDDDDEDVVLSDELRWISSDIRSLESREEQNSKRHRTTLRSEIRPRSGSKSPLKRVGGAAEQDETGVITGTKWQRVHR